MARSRHGRVEASVGRERPKPRTRRSAEVGDVDVLAAIESCGGVVTASALYRLGVPRRLVLGLAGKPALVRAMVRRTQDNVASMSDAEVVAAVVHKVASRSARGVAAAVYRRFDEIVLGCIETHREIPTIKAIARALRDSSSVRISAQSVGTRARANPRIRRALADRGIRWVEQASDRDVVRCLSRGASLRYFERPILEVLGRRFEHLVLEVLKRCPDVASGLWLTSRLRRLVPGLDEGSVRAWCKRLPRLHEAIRAQGSAFLRGAPASRFVAFFATAKAGQLGPEHRAEAEQRFVELVHAEVARFPGIPTARGVTTRLGFRTGQPVVGLGTISQIRGRSIALSVERKLLVAHPSQ